MNAASQFMRPSPRTGFAMASSELVCRTQIAAEAY